MCRRESGVWKNEVMMNLGLLVLLDDCSPQSPTISFGMAH
jgi:hypothetical protein